MVGNWMLEPFVNLVSLKQSQSWLNWIVHFLGSRFVYLTTMSSKATCISRASLPESMPWVHLSSFLKSCWVHLCVFHWLSPQRCCSASSCNMEYCDRWTIRGSLGYIFVASVVYVFASCIQWRRNNIMDHASTWRWDVSSWLFCFHCDSHLPFWQVEHSTIWRSLAYHHSLVVCYDLVQTKLCSWNLCHNLNLYDIWLSMWSFRNGVFHWLW